MGILCVSFEGTDVVHEPKLELLTAKLELLTAKFENLQMSEEETIKDFSGRLCDIANESFALREKISQERIVKKALRPLPLRFAYKATAIREAKDLKMMRIEELMRSLRTFEIELNEESKERKKLVGLRSKSKLPNDEGSEFSKLVALLSKNFERALKMLNTQAKCNSQTRKFAHRGFTLTRPIRTQETLGLNLRKKPIQCIKCGGYGHTQMECGNTKKN